MKLWARCRRQKKWNGLKKNMREREKIRNEKKKKESSINLVEIHRKSINERKNGERKLNG